MRNLIARLRGDDRGGAAAALGSTMAALLVSISLMASTASSTGAQVDALRGEQMDAAAAAVLRADLDEARATNPAAASQEEAPSEVSDGSTVALAFYDPQAGLIAAAADHDEQFGSLEREVNVRDFAGSYVVGYDPQGNPIWSQRSDYAAFKLTGLVAAGGRTCALDEEGRAVCWGANSHGQVGDGTTRDALSPVYAATRSTFESLAVSDLTTCGITTSRALECWGSNAQGQISAGVATQIFATPVAADAGQPYAQVALGSTGIAGITTAGVVRASGELTLSASPAFTNRPGGKTVAGAARTGAKDLPAIAADSQGACAIDAAGELTCWSTNKLGAAAKAYSADTSRRQAPQGSGLSGSPVGSRSVPIIVPAGQPSFDRAIAPTVMGGSWRAIYLAPEDTKTTPSVACGITSSGAASCWGGAGSSAGAASGAPSATGVVDIDVESSAACLTTSAGSVACWGSVPTPSLPGPVRDVDASTGNNATFCAAIDTTRTGKAGSRVVCWGKNDVGQGAGLDASYPNVESVAVSDQTTCASASGLTSRRADRTKTAHTGCFGRGDLGQRGDGTTDMAASAQPAGVAALGRDAHNYTPLHGYTTGGQR